MTMTDRVREVLDDESRATMSESYRQTQEFYKSMVDQGLVLKQEYTLPQLDTVGREIYHSLASPPEASS